MMIELSPTDVAHGGYCVARHDGIVVFVTGALPGERVRAEVTAKRSKLWYARVAEVLQPSPDRIANIWPEARRGVGGADLGHVSLEAGRRWKARVIEAQMLRLAHLPVQVEGEQAPGDEERAGLAWRTRVTLQVDDSGVLGMYAAKSHDIVPVTTMPLAHEEIQEAIARDLARPPRRGGGTRSYVRASHSGLTVYDRRPGRTDPVGTVEEQVDTRYGRFSYEVAADGFWQVHRQAPQVLVEAVLDAVGDQEGPVLDLYAGAGLFSVPLAQRATGPVTSVEGSAAAVRDLRANTAGLGVDCRTGDVAKTLSGITPHGHGVIVCDPPRSGAGARAVAQMERIGADKVVYVACDPASLARDVADFRARGYNLNSLRAFDLFPLTHHVESVAVLTRSDSRR